DDRGMDRTVVVLLWSGDVILESTRHHGPTRMHDADRLIALWERVHDDAKPENIRELLAPDRVGPFAPAGDFGVNAAIRELLGELPRDLGHQAGALVLKLIKPPADDGIRLRIKLAKRQIFQFLAHLVHAHA